MFHQQGICDGAAALIVVSEKALKEHNLTPLARIVSYAVSGVEPSIMGIGPVPAIKAALKKSGKSLQDMKLIEVCKNRCKIMFEMVIYRSNLL